MQPEPQFLPRHLHKRHRVTISAARMRSDLNKADDPFEGMATARVSAYLQRRFEGHDSKAKRIAAHYGWRRGESKAQQLHAGTYPKISADDIFRIVAADGAGALEVLFGDLTNSPLSGLSSSKGNGGNAGGEQAMGVQGGLSNAARTDLLAATAFIEGALAKLIAQGGAE